MINNPNNPQNRNSYITPIQKYSFVTLHYAVYVYSDNDINNKLIIANTFDGTPATITIGHGDILPILENALIGKIEDEEFEQIIPKAFGEYNFDLHQIISQDLIKEHSLEQDFSQGDAVYFSTNNGKIAGTFIKRNDNGSMVFDFNHPLSGKDIIFKAKIINIL